MWMLLLWFMPEMAGLDMVDDGPVGMVLTGELDR
jgi:hypothetical protein